VDRAGPLQTGSGHNLGPVVVRARMFSADYLALSELRQAAADQADIFEHGKAVDYLASFV